MHSLQVKFLLYFKQQPLDIKLHIQQYILQGNAEFPCLHVSLQRLVNCAVILSAETGEGKQRRILDQ